MRNGLRGALAGIAAAAVALGLAEFVAVFTGARSAPLVAVGGVVVDHAPEPLKQFAIDVFGIYDKVALLVGTLVLLAAFAALIGWLAVRNIWAGVVGIALFGIIGVAAALTRPGAGPSAAVPSLLGAAVAGVVLWRLVARRPAPAPEPGSATGRDDRRRFLTTVAVVVGAAAAAGLGGRFLATRRSVNEARKAVRLPVPASPAPAVPAGSDLDIRRLASYVTPNRTFYRIDTALVLPQVDPASWTLKIHGRVRNPITITFDELLARPMVERYVTLACVSNEVGGDLVGNARWLGVPVKELLDEAQPFEGADQVVGRSADGWTCGTPTALLRDGRDALIAVGMNGEPLPVKHGFPVRMVVPGLYGYVSACKWIVELELTSFADFDAYWVPRGWAAQAPIKTQSRIDTPRSGGKLTAGPVTVAGVAWAQHRGVAKVEVRVDGGPWREATLARSVSIDTWVQWMWRWDATPGEHRLQVRATDATGAVQPEQRRPPTPDGATGWHSVGVEVG
ncbi:molybdopterin-dependent oxidoreductase [Phytohabitans kaempferiae]|uniref:Molybdopterin-dependent oxidoreductase n=1 Tax=Phytohabitans kaempferiae TaxID=1620943 RepID=A0ABV6LVG7_9ACTN